MSGQTAIDALRAKQGLTDSIDPNFHADTLQLVYDDVLLLDIIRPTTAEYTNETPSVDTEYDTGYAADGGQPTLEISVIALITGGGNQNALFSRLTAAAALANPDVRISRTAQFAGVVGDATMTFWFSSVTSSVHVEVGFDGGGKTLDAIQVVSAYNEIAIVAP